MSAERVSICLPVHDPDPGQLAAVLASIAAQTRPVDEVVVSDDASATPVAALVAEIIDERAASLADRVRVVRLERNLGMTGNWNAAVRASSGSLVVVAHQDDALTPTQVERYLEAFEAPDVVLCSANELVVDASGAPTSSGGVNRRDRIYRDRATYLLDHDELVRLCLRNGQAYGEPTAVMFRRRAFDEVGGYAARYEHGADVDLVLRIARHGRAAYLRDQLVVRRLHAGNLTKRHIAQGASGRDRERLLADHLPTAALTPAQVAAIEVAVASHALYDLLRALRDRRWPVARAAAASLLRHGLRSPRAWAAQIREIVTGENLDRR